MASNEAFYKLLLAAESSARKNRDQSLMRSVEQAWQINQRINPGGRARCSRAVIANYTQSRCIREVGHSGDCEMWLRVTWDRDATFEVRALLKDKI